MPTPQDKDLPVVFIVETEPWCSHEYAQPFVVGQVCNELLKTSRLFFYSGVPGGADDNYMALQRAVRPCRVIRRGHGAICLNHDGGEIHLDIYDPAARISAPEILRKHYPDYKISIAPSQSLTD